MAEGWLPLNVGRRTHLPSECDGTMDTLCAEDGRALHCTRPDCEIAYCSGCGLYTFYRLAKMRGGRKP